jgi:hypothetical protein
MEAKIIEANREVTIPLNPKEFKSGRRGFNGSRRIDLGGKTYQATINLVDITQQISSKAQPPKGEEDIAHWTYYKTDSKLEPGAPKPDLKLDVPKKLIIPDRLLNDVRLMAEYSIKTDQETGGFLIKAIHGNIGVIAEQFGESREVVIQPNENLHEGERVLGSAHSHPITDKASTGDIIGFLGDEMELIMLVTGADKSINIYIKIDGITAHGNFKDIIDKYYSQDQMKDMAMDFGFLWYRAEEKDDIVLTLQNDRVDDVDLNIIKEEWPIEIFIEALGIEGHEEFPEEYFTKKHPIKKDDRSLDKEKGKTNLLDKSSQHYIIQKRY